MATAQDIIYRAFKKCRNNQPENTDVKEALDTLNDLIASTGPELITYTRVIEEFTITSGVAEYTIGDGGDFDTERPLFITNIVFSQNENYQNILPISLTDYNRIDRKALEGVPTGYIFLDEYPLAKIIFNCIPNQAFTIGISSIKEFTEFTSLTSEVNLPNHYKEYFIYNLAVRLAEEYGVELSESVYALAEKSKDSVINLNMINRKTPQSKFDFGTGILTGREQGGFSQGDIDEGTW